MARRLLIPWISLLALLAVPASRASSRALIVVGLAGSSENEEDFNNLAASTKKLLITRGFPADGIVTMTDHATRNTILQALKPAPGDSAADEFWLVLYGHSGTSMGGIPAFQVSGPRLTAIDLKTALDAIPDKEFVVIGTSNSGAFLPLLQSPRRMVVSATAGEGQTDQPRFPDKWVDAFTEKPAAPFAWIAARASALVDNEYQNDGLAQMESAQLADPVTGTILEPPFGQAMSAPAATPVLAQENSDLPTASDLDIEPLKQGSEWVHGQATDETRKILAEAKAAPNPDGDAALILDNQLKYTIEEDRTTDQVVYHRVYIAHEEAVEDWANCELPQSPPEMTSRLHIARVIKPDGSSISFDPAKLNHGAPNLSGDSAGSAMVYLPDVHAGSVVELGYETRETLDASLPEVSEALPVQVNVPVLKSEIEVRVPAAQPYRVVLKNSAIQPTQSQADGRAVYQWNLGTLTAAEPLPGDAPAQQWQVWLGISSLQSWDKFAAWYGRISNGSDVVDDSVKKVAIDLSQGANTRMEKMQRAFEFVSALRYIAIELGVQGFRPRTPSEVLANRYGDCKDKANLLVAILRCMNIDARFVLIDRGGQTDVNFPSWQFNHAICFVGKQPDAGQPTDMWLDSTDSITPFGYIAPGDYGRQAFVFFKEGAAFRQVAGTGKDISAIHDEWDLAQDAHGAWTGTFQRRTTGLADYAMRADFRSLSPGQRHAQIYQQLSDLWPGGDLGGASISDVSDLRHNVVIQATVGNTARVLPRPDFPWLKAFCTPQRDRPLLLNDGQQCAGTQTVRLHYTGPAPKTLPPAVAITVAGQTLRITWERADARTILRTAEISFPNATIPAADYAAVHRGVQDWTAELRRGEM
jgi:hypothetical protein